MGLTAALLLISCVAASVQGHGYLMDPPGRGSAWRFGFDTPVNYNDNENFCGGFSYQYQNMDGKCGICGDAWDADPRPHEVGGLYATGTLVRNYTKGQIIPVVANLTANHLGHFEYKICANNDVTVEATQECLDLTPLYGAGHEEWFLYVGDAVGAVSHELQLPADLECSQCVVQWRYVASNTWGTCDNGTEGTGCGPQEEFRACADVSILPPLEWEESVDLSGKPEEQIIDAEIEEEKAKEGNVNTARDEELTEEEDTVQIPQEPASKLKEMPSVMKSDDHDAEKSIKKKSKREESTEEESDDESDDDSEED